jgi:heme exporter protein D
MRTFTPVILAYLAEHIAAAEGTTVSALARDALLAQIERRPRRTERAKKTPSRKKSTDA